MIEGSGDDIEHIRCFVYPEGDAECQCGERFAAGATRHSAWERWCDHAMDVHTGTDSLNVTIRRHTWDLSA